MSLDPGEDTSSPLQPEEPMQVEQQEASRDMHDHFHDPAQASVQELPLAEVYITPPDLLQEERTKYKNLDDWAYDPSVQDSGAKDPEEVVGQYTEEGILYLFVRLESGVIRRYAAARFAHDYGNLYQDYERRKAEGNLAPFDPSSSSANIDAKSRVHLRIGILKGKKIFSMPKGRKNVRIPDSEDDFEESGDSGSELTDDEVSMGKKTTRVVATGGRKKTVRALPFSPKKTRSGKAFVSGSDESDADSDVMEIMPTRRSTRTIKKPREHLADDGLDDELDSFVNDGDDRARSKPVRRKARPRATLPAYGHFRSVDELNYDPYSDEETAPLREHRGVCEKCHRKPTHLLLKDARRGKPGRRKKRGSDGEEDDDDDDADKLTALGGWVRCLRCPVAAHWACLARTQQDEILRAVRERDRNNAAEQAVKDDVAVSQNGALIEVKKRAGLETSETTEFLCGSCTKGGVCMGCLKPAVEPLTEGKQRTPPVDTASGAPAADKDGDIEMKNSVLDPTPSAPTSDNTASESKLTPGELLFRCVTCKRVAHYAHLPVPDDFDASDGPPTAAQFAEFYQLDTKWLCADCVSFTFPLDKILAWRPYPPDATEPYRPKNEVPNYKNNLPREYLVKWADRSYRRLTWVPHMWLATTHGMKLKNFLESGPKVTLLPEPAPDNLTTPGGEQATADSVAVVPKNQITSVSASGPSPLPDAEKRIPLPWKTVDRVLDILFWSPDKREGFRKKSSSKRQKRQPKNRVIDDSDEDEDDERYSEERDAAFNEGEQPSADLTETLDEWEERTGIILSPDNVDQFIDRAVWVFVKWDDMGYDEATWDSPPRRGEFGWDAFRKGFERLIRSRDVVVHINPKTKADRSKDQFRRQFAFKHDKQPQLGQASGIALMPFQVEGVNWLCNNWWNLQHCILADEMGLGKTVQIASFIGTIAEKWEAFPALVVVPNSTITNWVREFERWAPRLRVVPFYGEAKAREVIKRYELTHTSRQSKTTGAKYHVLVTTYDTITNPKDFASVFKSTPRWEVLVVDEGQRLKGDGSQLFKKLNQLNTVHRILMTGTPLNNNMRELFNLMNFLDPDKWRDLEALEKEYEVLTEDLVKGLHERLRPYFLRRTKSEVLPLPPKNEVIVPVSMSPLQKEIYRSILSQNLQVLQSLTQASKSNSVPKSNMNNILMQLRKCLQHPYLVSNDIEPRGLPPAETHEKLVAASTKLRLLRNMLPKLKARGHRVLLFSQFVIALDVIEDFLVGEGYNYLRLDGDTKQADRQKGMDEFNRPGSDTFIYILSTRAGGVGINLWSADTVIIFDPDFNPHQDLQAIARSHRFGQTKPCLVFKLLVKDSAEERIMQNGKKKLVLDHLIVQKMGDDDEDAKEDVQSILMFGAKALFEDGTNDSSRDVNYSDQDIEKLIEKTETEGEQEDQAKQKDSGLFAFAKVWSADKDSFEEMADAVVEEQDDSWAQTLHRIEEERARERAQEVTGRGARRRVALLPQQTLKDLDIDESPGNGKKKSRRKSKSKSDDESDAYQGSVAPSGSDEEEPDMQEDDRALSPFQGPKTKQTHSIERPQAVESRPRHAEEVFERCGLCDLRHAPNACYMTENSENLAEYRRMLLIHADDEPLEDRRAAIQVIDETLYKRGHLKLIHGQPLLLTEPLAPSENLQRPRLKGPIASADASSKAGPSHTRDTMASAAPSKRPLSPLQGVNSKKLKQAMSPTPCIICGRLPHHLVKDCPLVAEGPKSVSREIQRLDKDPSQSQTVSILRKILSKQKKRELAEALGSDAATPMIVE